MDGGSELTRLADLLRLGAETARKIGTIRPWDAAQIEKLATQAEDMASELDAMSTSRRPATDGDGRGD